MKKTERRDLWVRGHDRVQPPGHRGPVLKQWDMLLKITPQSPDLC